MKSSIIVFISGFCVLLLSLLLVSTWKPTPESADGPAFTRPDTLASDSQVHPSVGAQVLNPWVRTVLNEELSTAERLQPLADGRLRRVESEEDIAAMRHILGDPEGGDTFRNEVANLLFRSEAPGMADDLLQVIRNQSGAQRDRFRSFAVQHLGLLWERDGFPEGQVYEGLLKAMDDPYVPLVRNALQALARGAAPAAKKRVEGWLADGAAQAYHDLCARLAADHQWREMIPAMRGLLDSRDRTTQVAALDALGRLGDTASRAAFAQAAQ